MSAPKVFISHSSKDKGRFVLRFAERLRSSGIDAWVDEWEIEPGDSLVEKIFEEGLAQADAMIVVLSENSINARWVAAELDVGVINNIERKTRLIPVLIDDVDVPEALRAKKWVRVQNLADYEAELNQIVNTIYGNSSKPPLGEPPAYVQDSLPQVPGLNDTDVQVLRRTAEIGLATGERMLSAEQVLRAMEQEELLPEITKDSLRMLDRHGLLRVQNMPHNDDPRIVHIEPRGLVTYADAFIPNIGEVHEAMLGLIVNQGVRDGAELAEKLSQHTLIVYALLDRLVDRGLIQVYSGGNSNVKYGVRYLIREVSPELRRLME